MRVIVTKPILRVKPVRQPSCKIQKVLFSYGGCSGDGDDNTYELFNLYQMPGIILSFSFMSVC